MNDLQERVKTIVARCLGVDASRVTEKAHFADDLGGDSLEAVEVIMQIEEEFGCDIPDDEAEKIVTVDDAVAFLEAHAPTKTALKVMGTPQP